MRDHLIHDYFGVDYELVWDVVRHRVPELRRQLVVLTPRGSPRAVDLGPAV
jgi:uncharacterized protein with HEPN domain